MILSKTQLIVLIGLLVVALIASVGFNGFYTRDLHGRMMICGDLDARIGRLEKR